MSPTGWPTLLTSFIGREREVAEIVDKLGDPSIRLLTLTGPGGVGKTRISLEAGARLRNEYEDGVVFIDLATITDHEAVPIAIARSLGVRESGDRLPVDQLRPSLRDKETLLILDNFEQVIGAARFLSELLTSCPALKLMVTSRVALHLSGEHEYAIPPMAVPASTSSLEEVAASEAVRLFFQRARATRADLTLNGDNVEAVVEICRRLDGLPLAIELAAARSKVLSPSALLARLNHSLQILTSGPQDQPGRLQTMRAAIGWSHELLSADEQALIQRLSVFVGGFTLEAAEALCGHDVFDLVASLFDKNLLRQEIGIDDEPRFRMLEMVREYELERLDASGEADATRQLHADWCQRLAEASWNAWRGREEVERLIRLIEREHYNIRAALAFHTERRNSEAVMALSGPLFWFWYIRGYLREGRDWLTAGLVGSDISPTIVRTRALLGAGTISHYLGDEARAQPYLQECLAGARAIDSPWLKMFALLVLGITSEHRGNYDQAKPLFDEALALARQTGDQIGLAHALSHRGLVGWASGEDQLGEELIHEALAVQRAAGDSWGTGDSLDLLGLVTSARGDYAKALTYVEESLSKRLALGAAKCTPWSFEIVGLLASAAGRSRESARLFGAAANLRERIGSPGHEPERSAYKAAIDRARSDLGQSEFDLEWSAGLAHSVDEAMAETRSVIATLKSVEAPVREKPADTGFGLTERELDVLRLLVEGRSDREIGDELYISSRTAQKHAANIFMKLNVSSRTAAATAAIRAGLVANEKLKVHVSEE